MSTVRASKYRHVYGAPFKKDRTFDNIRLTKNAFDSNLAKANGKYVSLCWNASGGGAFAVLPLSQLGKLPDRFPLFNGHRGAVLDTDWNPFDSEEVVTASDDGTIGIWRVPNGFSVQAQDGAALDDVADVAPVRFLEGHEKKVGHVHFSPVADGVLASSSLDTTIKIWDVKAGEVLYSLKHPDAIMSFAWNYDGTQIVSVSRDKKIRVWDVRAEKVLSEGAAHTGSKSSRVVWLGDRNRVLTTGFSRLSDRQLAIWDTTDLAKGPINGFKTLDQSSGVIMPFFDISTSILYLGGRGDGTIVYYEFAGDALHELFAYQSTAPQRGLAFAPDVTLDVRNHEVARCYKVHETFVEPIPFLIPRKTEGFLSDIYTTALADKPALTAQQFVEGKTSLPLVVQWRDIYDGKDVAAKPATSSGNSISNGTTTETKKAEPVRSESPKDAPSPKDTSAKAPEPKAQEKSEVTSTKEVHALDKASKQDAGDVFKSNNVQNFLSKAKDSESDKPEEKTSDASSWDDEEAEKGKKIDAEVVKKVKAEAKGAEVRSPSPDAAAKPDAGVFKGIAAEDSATKADAANNDVSDKGPESVVIETAAIPASGLKDKSGESTPAQKEKGADAIDSKRAVENVSAKLGEIKKEQSSEEAAGDKELTPAPSSTGSTASPAKTSIGKLAALNDQVSHLTALVSKLTERVAELESKQADNA